MQSPSNHASPGKHPCPDCKMCQNCAETRCAACRSKGGSKAKCRLSIQEQIALFNSLNPGLEAGSPVRSTACANKQSGRTEG